MSLPWLGIPRDRTRAARGTALTLLLALVGACIGDQPTEPKRHTELVSPSVTSTGVFRDDFTDVDSTLLENHTPTGGIEPFSWVNGYGQALVVGNSLVPHPAWGDNWLYMISEPAGDWAEVTVDVVRNHIGANSVVAIYLRTDTSWWTGYQVRWSIMGDGRDHIIEVVPPPYGNYGVWEWVPPSVGLHTLRAEITASGAMEISVDGQVIITHPLGPLAPPNHTWLELFTPADNPYVRIRAFSAASNTPPIACTPSVERGQEVICTYTPSQGSQVTSWEFVPDSAHFLDVHDTTSITEWRGLAATGGVVKVHVTEGNTPRTYESRFTVTNRRSRWKESWDYKTNNGLITDAEVTSSTPYFGINCPQQFPSPADCLLHSGQWLQPGPGLEPGYTATPIESGPNRTYWFITNIRYNMRRFGGVHPGLLPTSPRKHPVSHAMFSKACKAGLGAKNAASASANMNQATQYCGLQGQPGYDMNRFIAGLWGHEGYGYGGGVGHQTLAEQSAGQPHNDPYTAIEDLVFPDSAGLAGAVNILVVPIAVFINQFAGDANPINGGPQGNWTPTPGRYVYYWEPQSGGVSAWTPYALPKGY